MLVRDKQTGDGILLFLSCLILGLLFALALDALSLPEQMISKTLSRSEMHGNGYIPMKKKAGVCLAK